jgi:hypothetical protein
LAANSMIPIPSSMKGMETARRVLELVGAMLHCTLSVTYFQETAAMRRRMPGPKVIHTPQLNTRPLYVRGAKVCFHFKHHQHQTVSMTQTRAAIQAPAMSKSALALIQTPLPPTFPSRPLSLKIPVRAFHHRYQV